MAGNIVIRDRPGRQSPVDFRIDRGHWHPDGWMSSDVLVALQGLPRVSRLDFSAYVNDVSLRLFGSVVTVTLGGEQFVHKLAWGGATAIACVLREPLSGAVPLAIRASGFLVPDALDSRERAVVVKELVLAV